MHAITIENEGNKPAAEEPRRGVISESARRQRLRECEKLGKLTGWHWDPSELGDFYHRPRSFTKDVGKWRRQLVKAIRRGEVASLVSRSGKDESEIRGELDEIITRLREISRILAVLHGTPDLGNKIDPVDELVYIILSRKTRESAYQAAFDALKERFPTWDELLDADREEVENLVRASGLSGRKTTSLFGALYTLRERFGSCTLDPASDWADDDLEKFLCSLPEIQRKSAYCVMMYAMGRKAFPVDTHVGRVLARLAPFRSLGLDLGGLDHKKLQSALCDLVPPDVRHSLHVNLVVHGRAVCKSLRPHCDRCELARFCRHHRTQQVEVARNSDRYTFMDLFCGAGGMSLGVSESIALTQPSPCFRCADRNALEAAIRLHGLKHEKFPGFEGAFVAIEAPSLSADQCWSGTLMDINGDGMALSLPSELAPGVEVLLTLRLGEDTQLNQVPAVVIRSQEADGGGAVEFKKWPEDDRLLLLGYLLED